MTKVALGLLDNVTLETLSVIKSYPQNQWQGEGPLLFHSDSVRGGQGSLEWGQRSLSTTAAFIFSIAAMCQLSSWRTQLPATRLFLQFPVQGESTRRLCIPAGHRDRTEGRWGGNQRLAVLSASKKNLGFLGTEKNTDSKYGDILTERESTKRWGDKKN